MRTSRIILVAMSIGIGATSVAAKAQGGLADQIAVCARISKKDARLECYDSAARPSPHGTLTSGAAAPTIQAPQSAFPAPPPKPSASAAFGAEQIDRPIASQPRKEEPDSLVAIVASSRENGAGLWRFSLSDGAVWRMTERSSTFRPPSPNESVTIRKGALSAYLMHVGRQAAIRVERVR
jgi:hypothetical protein